MPQANLNMIPPFVGGNVDQCDHLNQVVDAVNDQGKAIELLQAKNGVKNPLQVVVANANASRLSLIELADAHHLADFGSFIAPKMHPWQPFIADVDTDTNGRAQTAYINFNPLSTLWGLGGSEWDGAGCNWDNRATIVNFPAETTTNTGPRMAVTAKTDVVYLEVVLGVSIANQRNAKERGKVGRLAVEQDGWDKRRAGGTLYHLLTYFRPKRDYETTDIVFSDGEECVMVPTTYTDLLVGIVRQNNSGTIDDFPALIPWFKTYEAS